MIFNHETHEKHETVRDQFPDVTKLIMEFYPIDSYGFGLAKGVEIDPFGMGTKTNLKNARMVADYIRVEFEAVKKVKNE